MVIGLTREMLRPMLKTWLDDNLPVIVERLVSAEIERVARGETKESSPARLTAIFGAGSTRLRERSCFLLACLPSLTDDAAGLHAELA